MTWITSPPQLLDPPGTVCIAFREWDEKYIVTWTHPMGEGAGGTTRSTRVCDSYTVAICSECGEKVIGIPIGDTGGFDLGHAEDCPLVNE